MPPSPQNPPRRHPVSATRWSVQSLTRLLPMQWRKSLPRPGSRPAKCAFPDNCPGPRRSATALEARLYSLNSYRLGCSQRTLRLQRSALCAKHHAMGRILRVPGGDGRDIHHIKSVENDPPQSPGRSQSATSLLSRSVPSRLSIKVNAHSCEAHHIGAGSRSGKL